ncbi:hypothetical protein BLNAU_1302 [Blattamonas nauphoetae]|uniref:Surface antigen BspA-like n=1 Tax=Blattamonas nauphoetae TaxID=2049346 RepID=A0ABQ9YJ23_9EUKA|nr:hypothetical protein BLNAU_1302 [Blattamonas nauphoetae]
MIHHTMLYVILYLTSLFSAETLDLSRANSGSFELTAQLYEGDSVALSNIDYHLFATAADVMLRPEVGAMTLLVAESNSHTVSNMSLSLNNAKSFSQILSGSLLELVGCVMADEVITGPLAVINGGTGVFRELIVNGARVHSPIICSESASNGTFKTIASKYADLQVTAPNQLFNVSGLTRVEINSCNFKEIEYLTDSKESTEEASAPITTGVAEAYLNSNTFNAVQSPLTHVVLPLFTAQKVEMHSSTIKSCFSSVKVPAYTIPDNQNVYMHSNTFKESSADIAESPHMLNLNSKGLVLSFHSTTFKECTSYGSVLAIPFATKINMHSISFKELTVHHTNESAFAITNVPVSLKIHSTLFHTCTSVGPAGALSFGDTTSWNESKPVDPEVPVDPETPEDPDTPVDPEGRNGDDDSIEPSFVLSDLTFHYCRGSEVSDILVAFDTASPFSVATFSNCQSSSEQMSAIIGGQVTFRLDQIETPGKGWVGIGVPWIGIVAVGIVVAFVFGCAGLCCCACPCCCGSSKKGFCCRNNHKCCCGVGKQAQEGERGVVDVENQTPQTVVVCPYYVPYAVPATSYPQPYPAGQVAGAAPVQPAVVSKTEELSPTAPFSVPASSTADVNKEMPPAEPQQYQPSQPPTEHIPSTLPPPRSTE